MAVQIDVKRSSVKKKKGEITLLIDGCLLGDLFSHRICDCKSSINVDNSPNEVPSETSPSLLRLLM